MLSKVGEKIETTRRHCDRWLPARRPLGYSLIHQASNTIQLHASDDCADVDRLIKRRSNAQIFHATAHFRHERFRNTFLHQQARTGATNLSLIEPDSVDQAFDCAVQVGILEHNEGRLAAKLERKPFAARGRRPADGAPDLGGPREGDLIDVRVLDERLTGRTIARDDVHDARPAARSPGKCLQKQVQTEE